MHRSKHAPAMVVAGAFLAVAGAALGDTGKAPAPGTPAASAAPGKLPPPAQSAPLASGRAPKGFTIVSSGPLTAPNGRQTRGVATCPAGLVPLGGGVFVDSVSTAANVNSSFPSGSSWAADINNASGAPTTFDVRVTCARAPRHYAVVSGTSVLNPAGAQTTATVRCPRGSRPLGGGGLSNAGLTPAVNMNSTLPSGNGWRVDQNNASGFDFVVTAFVVCGKVGGYVVAAGPPTTTPANSQTISRAICPGGGVPTGGGVFSQSGSTAVNINTTDPSGIEWDSYINNATAAPVGEQAFAICAGAVA